MSDRTGVFSGLSGTVPRASLIRKMKAAGKNIFLAAPGGYGKTVAAAQWLASVRGKSVRMAAGAADNNPGFFYKRLAAALLRLTGREKAMPDTVISFDRLLEIIRLLPKKSARHYFVLDDLHLIKNEEIIGNLPVISARLPGYIRRFLASRAEPTAAFMETGLFEIFTKDDLLFSPEEVEWLGAEKNRDLTRAQIEDLLETTGGWAMYLSALLSDDQGTVGKAPRTLAQYLDARVWEPWDRETKTLLLSLAVPAEITPALAERLTGRAGGRGLLERLTKTENAFLSRTETDTYRFHDLFHDFLMGHMDTFLGRDEIRRLNGLAAGWYCEQGDYYAGARHYIHNRDHEGINRCMEAVNRFHEDGISVENKLNFTKQYVMNLTPEFIAENPYLISKCVVASFHDGDAAMFMRYSDLLHRTLGEISAKKPEVMGNYGFTFSLDFRVSLKVLAQKVAAMMPLIMTGGAKAEAKVSNITQNLPFFHRSMRDYSEYHELRDDELKMVRDTFGAMIGQDYDAIEEAIRAGLYYERGELLEAARHALGGCHAFREGLHPEIFFCAHMILAATLYAMGASREAEKIMERTEAFIERKAPFLRQNFKALKTERAVREGDEAAAREWLTVYANRSSRLPFYQICRHFTTLRSFITVRDYPAAAAFGTRLLTLAAEYNRPLDQAESGLLTALALWAGGRKSEAVEQLERAVNTARPYGFTQLFINEGREVLPLMWELRKGAGGPLRSFVDRLTDDIYRKYSLKPAGEERPRLTEQQRAMLPYLGRGLTYSEIAREANLGRGTVKSHVLLLYKRLGVRSAPEAVVKAKMLGLL